MTAANVLIFPRAKKPGPKVKTGPLATVTVIYEAVPKTDIDLSELARVAFRAALEKNRKWDAWVSAHPQVIRFPESAVRVRSRDEVSDLMKESRETVCSNACRRVSVDNIPKGAA